MTAGNFEFKSILIPDGTYPVVLSRGHRFKIFYGDSIGFEFTLTGIGETIVHTSGTNLSLRGVLYATLRCLLTRELSDHELKGVDWDGLIGKSCCALVQEASNKSGGSYSTVTLC